MPETENWLNDKTTDQQVWQLPDAEFVWQRGFLSEAESQQLIAHLSTLTWQQPTIKLFGKSVRIPRQQIWMGDAHCSYRYSGVTFHPTAWTTPLQQLCQRVQSFLQIPLNAVLLNWYQHGEHHMGWHSDDEPELGKNPLVASLSVGQSRRFDLRHKSLPLQCSIELADGDLFVMAGACQHFWQHRLPKQSKAQGGRFNLTFRYLPIGD